MVGFGTPLAAVLCMLALDPADLATVTGGENPDYIPPETPRRILRIAGRVVRKTAECSFPAGGTYLAAHHFGLVKNKPAWALGLGLANGACAMRAYDQATTP